MLMRIVRFILLIRENTKLSKSIYFLKNLMECRYCIVDVRGKKVICGMIEFHYSPDTLICCGDDGIIRLYAYFMLNTYMTIGLIW